LASTAISVDGDVGDFSSTWQFRLDACGAVLDREIIPRAKRCGKPKFSLCS
jgi:hypothetical protein